MASYSTSSSTTNNSTSETSAKTKDDLFNEILICGICLSRMAAPCCLPCAHSFCRSCLLDYAQNNNMNISTPINYILCPYCKFQLNFRSYEHLESLLIINPILKQLCEVLDMTKSNGGQTNGPYHARCHTCCSLKMLKVCKHCYFMLCETCRRTHLLDVHRESKLQLNVLESHIRLINEKREQLDKINREYDYMRENIKNYADRFIQEIEQQQDQALQILDERQHANDEAFWLGNGFDNGEKLDFFVSLAETAKRKLSAKNITDKELMELSDNLLTIPDVNEEMIASISFAPLNLELDETFLNKQFIGVYDDDLTPPTIDIPEKLINDHEQTDSAQS